MLYTLREKFGSDPITIMSFVMIMTIRKYGIILIQILPNGQMIDMPFTKCK